MIKSTMSILFLMAFTTVFSQNNAISFSATGKLFDRPIYLEYEHMTTSKISVALRLNYLNYDYTNTGSFTQNNHEVPVDYNYNYDNEGFGAGIHTKVYLSKKGEINGFYVGAGADLLKGNFKYIAMEVQDIGRIRPGGGQSIASSSFENFTYFTTTFPVGYKFRMKKSVIDLSVSLELDHRRSEMIRTKDRLDKTASSFEYVVPGLSAGIVF